MDKKSTISIDQAVVRFILTSKYFLKQARVPKSNWRKRIALEFTPKNPGKSDAFVAAWEYLESAGLIQ